MVKVIVAAAVVVAGIIAVIFKKKKQASCKGLENVNMEQTKVSRKRRKKL